MTMPVPDDALPEDPFPTEGLEVEVCVALSPLQLTEFMVPLHDERFPHPEATLLRAVAQYLEEGGMRPVTFQLTYVSQPQPMVTGILTTDAGDDDG